MQAGQVRDVRAADVDDEIVDVLVQVAKQTQVVRRSVFVARLRVFAEVAADDLVRTAVADLPNVEAELWPGLLADFAVRHHASAIVRGVRNTTDFDVEYQMALINRGIHPELETLLLPASAAYQHFSSSMAREMIRYHQPLENYLPASIVPLVREMTEKKEG